MTANAGAEYSLSEEDPLSTTAQLEENLAVFMKALREGDQVALERCQEERNAILARQKQSKTQVQRKDIADKHATSPQPALASADLQLSTTGMLLLVLMQTTTGLLLLVFVGTALFLWSIKPILDSATQVVEARMLSNRIKRAEGAADKWERRVALMLSKHAATTSPTPSALLLDRLVRGYRDKAWDKVCKQDSKSYPHWQREKRTYFDNALLKGDTRAQSLPSSTTMARGSSTLSRPFTTQAVRLPPRTMNLYTTPALARKPGRALLLSTAFQLLTRGFKQA